MKSIIYLVLLAYYSGGKNSAIKPKIKAHNVISTIASIIMAVFFIFDVFFIILF